MSVADVTSRIAQIQGQLAMLAPRGTVSGQGAAFASVLDRTAAAAPPASPLPVVGLDESGQAVTLGWADQAGSGSPTSGVTGEQVVDEAEKYLGIPYLWGGTDPDKGLDCSGLVQLVYREFGVELPRVSRDQARVGEPVDGLENARPGDLLAFGSPVHHIAIYAGDGMMVEAPRTGLDVRVTEVPETPSAIRRVLGTEAAAGAAPVSASAAGSGSAGAVPYAGLFTQASARYGVDADLLAAVAKQESGFDPRAVSPAGAQGLMQLMPATAAGLGVDDSFDPAQAVDGAARLLRDLLDRFGTTPLALAAYNAGPGAVLRYDGIPPYPETRTYVSSIMSMLGSN